MLIWILFSLLKAVFSCTNQVVLKTNNGTILRFRRLEPITFTVTSSFVISNSSDVPEVTIGSLKCQNVTFQKILSNTSTCTTASYSCVPQNTTLREFQSTVDVVFLTSSIKSAQITAKQKPYFEPVADELKTFVRGGLPLTVRGAFFNKARIILSVERIHLSVRTHAHSELCKVVTDNLLECKFPDLLHKVISKAEEAKPVTKYNDKFTRFFAMLVDWDEVRPIHNRTLVVFTDPSFMNVNEPIEYYAKEHKLIHIEGRELTHVPQQKDFSVALGRGNCVVKHLYHNELQCEPPELQPESSLHNQTLPELVVTVGNIVHLVGFVRYIEFKPMSDDVTTGMAVGVGFAVFVILTLVIILAWRRRRIKKPMHVPPELDLEDPSQWTNPGYVEGERPSGDEPRVSRNPRAVAITNAGRSPRSVSVSTAESDLTIGHASAIGSEAPSEASSAPRSVVSGASLPAYMWSGIPEETRLALEHCEVDILRLEVAEVVGQGHFGKVYRGVLLDDKLENPQRVAVKTVHGTRITSRDLTSFLEEAIVMKDFSHPHVLSLLGVCLDRKKPFVILPFMENGDLKSYITDPERRIKVRDLLELGKQVASGMCYLSQQKFVHRDLASRNCMLDACLRVKIADFGLSRDIYKSNYYRVEDRLRPLPVKWMAIESLSQGVFSTKSDVWSFGVLLWELLTRGCPPYADIDGHKIKNYLHTGRRLEQPEHAPDQVFALMSSCWLEDPEYRPEFSKIHHQIQEILDADIDTHDAYAIIT